MRARAARLVARTFPLRDRDAVLGDLLEGMAGRRARGRPVWSWLATQAVRSMIPNARRRLRGDINPMHGAQAPKGGPLRGAGGDVRYALRLMRRNPWFALMLAGTLGLGIGANTLIFSVVDNVVLNPFPFPEPSRLVGIGPVFPRLNQELGFWEVLSPAEYLDIRDGAQALERAVAWDMGNRELSGDNLPAERVFTAFWWGDALATLGVSATTGRGFLPEEIAGGARVAILSHRIWQRLFAGDTGIVGRSVGVNGEPYTVVGVMPPGTLIYGTDLWTPMPVGPEVFPRGRRQFQVLARIRDGANMEQAEQDLARIAARVEADHGGEHDEYAGWRLIPATWNDINVQRLRPAALTLGAAVAFVLLIVCVNVASLTLARSASRRREVAVRAALGAERLRLARQLLTESVLLASLGAMIGLALAWAGVLIMASVIPTLGLPIATTVAVDGRVLLFTAAITMLVGIATGLAPVLATVRSDVQSALRAEGTGGATARGRHRVQRVFVAVEVALAILLLAGGGLLVNSFVRLQSVDPGFAASNLLTMRLTLPQQRYPEQADVTAFFRTLREQVEAQPGIVAAGVTTQLPGAVFQRMSFELEGQPVAGEDTRPTAYATIVDDGFFATLGLEPVSGRFPVRGESRPVVVVNQELAQRWFGPVDPVGRRINVNDAWIEIVGVTPSIHNVGLERAPAPEMYGPMEILGGGNQFFLMVRTAGDPRAALPVVRGVVQSLDRDQPIYAIRTASDIYASALVARRFTAGALAAFALVALTLAAVGIYAVVAFAVSERTREIGVRVALGAAHGQVRWLVVRQALLPVLIGCAAGLLAAIAAGRLLASQLFEVRAADPPTLIAVLLLFAAIALIAAWVPARRATRLDPLRALRLD